LLLAWYDTVGRACSAMPAIGEFISPSGVQVWLAAAVTKYQGRVLQRSVCEPAGQELFGYHDPLSEQPLDERMWDGFWLTVRAALGSRCDLGLFRFVHERYAGTQLRERAGDASPVLTFDGANRLDDMLARCSSNHRGDVRRRLRRLAERGALRLRVFGAGEVDEAILDFQSAFRPEWRTRPASASARPGFEAFCERVVLEGLRVGFAHYCALSLDAQPIAWHLGLRDSGRLYWWMPVHRPEWDAYSPGKVLLALLIEQLAREGYRELHFQTGRQPYKLSWRPAEPPLSAVRWHAPGVKGRLLAGYDAVSAR
jgi:CelD/BcsL family acetyltransferase involved in cellulose biosynthesis